MTEFATGVSSSSSSSSFLVAPSSTSASSPDTSRDAVLARSIPSARPPDFQGPLKKKGVTPGWKERYFRLYGSVLAYWKDQRPMGEFDLVGASAETAGVSVFVLKGPRLPREVKLDAGTGAARGKWLRKLEEAGVDVGAGGAKWNCKKCTLLNSASARRCIACGCPKQQEPRPPTSGNNGSFDITAVDIAGQSQLLSEYGTQQPQLQPSGGTRNNGSFDLSSVDVASQMRALAEFESKKEQQQQFQSQFSSSAFSPDAVPPELGDIPIAS